MVKVNMKSTSDIYMLIIFACFLCNKIFLLPCNGLSSARNSNRHKRTLIFPETAPTRVQLIVGIGIPLDLEHQAITTGYVLKAQYFLPINATDFHFDVLPATFANNDAASRKARAIEEDHASSALSDDVAEELEDPITGQKYRRYQVEAIEVEKGSDENTLGEENFYATQDWTEWNEKRRPVDGTKTARWGVYRGIETIADRMGLVGRACMLRSICEAAETPFHYRIGILGELLHIVMSPSTSMDPLTRHSDNEYFKAELLGQNGAPCAKIFNECERSLLDEFTGTYTPAVGNVLKLMASKFSINL